MLTIRPLKEDGTWGAKCRMERRGIQTEKGNINREIAADNKLLKEIKARITRLYNWSKEQSAQPQGRTEYHGFSFPG